MNRGAFQFLRYFQAALFGFTALGKMLDVRGFAGVVATYQLGVPENLLWPLAVMVCVLEMALALSLLRGRRPRRDAAFCLLGHLFYLALALTTLARGITLTNCGCFGVFLARPLTWTTPVEDGVLALTALWFWFISPSSYSASNRNRKTSV